MPASRFVIGVDLGTTNCALAYVDTGRGGDLDSWIEGDTSNLIFHTKAERDRYAALLELGLVDVFRQRHPDKKAFSWWDFRGGAFHKGQGLRIDMVLATAPTAQRVKDVVIDRDYRKKLDGLISSDHAPVFVDLD